MNGWMMVDPVERKVYSISWELFDPAAAGKPELQDNWESLGRDMFFHRGRQQWISFDPDKDEWRIHHYDSR